MRKIMKILHEFPKILIFLKILDFLRIIFRYFTKKKELNQKIIFFSQNFRRFPIIRIFHTILQDFL